MALDVKVGIQVTEREDGSEYSTTYSATYGDGTDVVSMSVEAFEAALRLLADDAEEATVPDSPLVTLTVWRDAKTDPPLTDDSLMSTDQGHLFMGDDGLWCYHDALDDEVVADPQPSVWCDPLPPGDDALTAEDLRCLTEPPDAFSPTLGQRRYWQAAARLRRALDTLEK